MALTFWLLFTVSFLKIKTIPIHNLFVLYLQLLIELNSMKKYELQIIFMFLDVHNFCKSELRCSYQIRSYRKRVHLIALFKTATRIMEFFFFNILK